MKKIKILSTSALECHVKVAFKYGEIADSVFVDFAATKENVIHAIKARVIEIKKAAELAKALKTELEIDGGLK